jgi:hypothetical protein
LTVDCLVATLRDGPVPVSRSTLYDWRNGAHLPQDREALLAVVRLCLRQVPEGDADLGPAPNSEGGWEELLAEVQQARDARSGTPDPLDDLRAEVDRRAGVLMVDFEICFAHIGGLQAQPNLIPEMMSIITGVTAQRQAVNGHRDTQVGGQAFSRLVAIRIPG